MSSYNCVVPVDWARLWDELVPAWLSLLAGEIGPAEFRARYLPAGEEDEAWIDPREHYHAAPEYLAVFARRPLSPPYAAQDLRVRLGGDGFPEPWRLHNDEYLLLDAIGQSATVDLPGEDRFADTVYSLWKQHWGSRQVAGSKNLFHFVYCVYEWSWQRERGYYACARRPGAAPPRLFEFFEDLFLFRRALPGAIIAECPPSWPAHENFCVAGYLAPDETRRLLVELEAWEAPQQAQDEWLALFVDRVRRCADAGHGLLTLHGGL